MGSISTEADAAPTRSPSDWLLGEWNIHVPMLRRFVEARMKGAEHAVDDVLQEILLSVHNSANPGLMPEQVASWLRQVAAYRMQDYWRKRQRNDRLEQRLSDLGYYGSLSENVTPFDWILRLEKQEAVTAALKALAPEDRILLEQKYLQERDCRDIASSSGITLKALEYRLSRARQAIRDFLNHL